VTIAVAAPTIVISPTSLPAGQVGVAYNQTLSASGGATPYVFSITGGTVPAGLSLTNGVLSGTPTATSSSFFTITAIDSNGVSAAQACGLTINAAPSSGGGGGGGGGGSPPKAAPTAVLDLFGGQGGGGGGGAPLLSAPAPVLPPVASAPPPAAPATAAALPVVVPDTSIRFSAPLAPAGVNADNSVLDWVVVHPTHPSDFLAQIPDGMRIEITAADQALPSDVSQAQLGSLGGGNAVRLAPPVDLQLLAKDIASNSQVPLPDGTLAQTFQVSLPVIAEPTSTDETFTWLVGVHEDGQFLGYMRYPSTFDPQTNSLVFVLTGQGLQTITVLPVIIQPSKVQAFLDDVHTWSSPFKDGVDFGVLGSVWNSYAVLAPQVGARIGILSPEGSDMIWIDASGVGPAGNATADNPTVGVPDGATTPADLADLAVVKPDGTGAP
jgi:hypothetical protein